MYNRLVRKTKTPEDLSIDELRQLMVEKRRKTRMQHLERFRQTGRVVTLTSDDDGNSDGHLHSNTETELNTYDQPASLFDRIKNSLDHFLLGIEILAVIGLFFIIFSGIQILRNLNTQYSEALIPSTLTPTPLIVPVILPSGHTPPNSQNGAQPNEGEIPAHLLPLYQSMAHIPIPTPGPEQAIQIQIPMINVDAPVVQGDGWEQLKKVWHSIPDQLIQVKLEMLFCPLTMMYSERYSDIWTNCKKAMRSLFILLTMLLHIKSPI